MITDVSTIHKAPGLWLMTNSWNGFAKLQNT